MIMINVWWANISENNRVLILGWKNNDVLKKKENKELSDSTIEDQITPKNDFFVLEKHTGNILFCFSHLRDHSRRIKLAIDFHSRIKWP